jgi:hypothetical protein
MTARRAAPASGRDMGRSAIGAAFSRFHARHLTVVPKDRCSNAL